MSEIDLFTKRDVPWTQSARVAAIQEAARKRALVDATPGKKGKRKMRKKLGYARTR